MQALVIDAPGTIALRDVAFAPFDGDCTVRVLRAGICGTDLQLLDGYADFSGVPGHEFVGVVDSVERDADAGWLGARVVAEINVGCGKCAECRMGVKEHCARRTVIGIRGRSGAFAEYVSVPSANLHAVPDTLSADAAVFVEPTAAACRILEQIGLTDRMRVAVLGDGRMGLIAGQVLKTATPHVTILGRHDHKLAIARAIGLDAMNAESAVPHIYDVVVDVTGHADGLARAIDLTRPRGTVVMKSTVHGTASLASWPVVVNEVTLVGSRCGPFARAIALLASGAVQVEPLVSAVCPMHEYARAFEWARKRLKVIFDIARR